MTYTYDSPFQDISIKKLSQKYLELGLSKFLPQNIFDQHNRFVIETRPMVLQCQALLNTGL